MAVANYETTFGSMPPAVVLGPDVLPWHSWRVLVLPFLERKDLYDQYRFDEPWNGPNNKKLEPLIRSTFQRPEDAKDSPYTRFVAVIGDHTAFPPPGIPPRTTNDLPDGPAHTLLFVEVQGLNIPWMAPRDLNFDTMPFEVTRPGQVGIGSPYGGARAALADTTILSLTETTTTPELLRALLTADGGEPLARNEDGDWQLFPRLDARNPPARQ